MKSVILKAALSTTLALGLILASVPLVKADGTAAAAPTPLQQRRQAFAKKHPRRAQVVGRANHQEKNINNAASSGKLTGAQAQRLDSEDQKLKAKERSQAAANGGHITKLEQRQDNFTENKIHGQETRDEHKDATAGGTPPVTAPTAPGQPVTPPAAQ